MWYLFKQTISPQVFKKTSSAYCTWSILNTLCRILQRLHTLQTSNSVYLYSVYSRVNFRCDGWHILLVLICIVLWDLNIHLLNIIVSTALQRFVWLNFDLWMHERSVNLDPGEFNYHYRADWIHLSGPYLTFKYFFRIVKH